MSAVPPPQDEPADAGGVVRRDRPGDHRGGRWWGVTPRRGGGGPPDGARRGPRPARFGPAARRAARAVALGAAGGAAALALGFGLFVAEATAPAAPPPEALSGIAVLTGGPDRIAAGLRLAAARPGVPLLVSGVSRDADLATLARAAGAEPWPVLGRVTLGRAARSTRGNAEEVAAWAAGLGPAAAAAPVAVVTAGFHMPRATLELRRALPPGAALHPVPVEPRLARPVAMAREFAKLVAALAGVSGRSVAGTGAGDGGGGASEPPEPGPLPVPRPAGGRA